MPTLIENPTPTSSKFNSRPENRSTGEPKVLTKFDTKLYKTNEISHLILDGTFKTDSDTATDEDELNLNRPLDENEIDDEKVRKFKPKQYDGFKVKVLPTKEKIIVRNQFIYLDPKTFSIVWLNIGLFVILHSLGFLGVYKCFTEKKFGAFAASYVIGLWGAMGITAGAHRLWSHRSYKARLPLRIFLMLGHTIAGQNNLYVWCRDHRVHHKFSESDADPHNSKRGFFFAHMGWLLRKKHPNVFTEGAKVPMDDLLADPVVRFNVKFYYAFYFFFAFFLPTWIGAYIYNEGWWYSFLVGSAARYMTSLHSTWFVNSAAHMFGDQPYSLNQQARENPFVSAGAYGEGYHNYHHKFPFDYSTSEHGTSLNLTKVFIDLMAFFGLAYDLKRCSRKMIDAAMAKALIIKSGKDRCAY